jgi:hypothetical protein
MSTMTENIVQVCARFDLTISLTAATGLVARVFPARLVFTSDTRQVGYF